MKTILSPKHANTLAAISLWSVCLVGGLFCFNSSQATFEYQFEHTANAEPEATTLARSNFLFFNRNAPRQDLIVGVSPWGRSRANAWDIFLAPNWKNQSLTDQKRLIQTWTSLWFERMRTNPANQSQHRLRIFNADGSLAQQLVDA